MEKIYIQQLRRHLHNVFLNNCWEVEMSAKNFFLLLSILNARPILAISVAIRRRVRLAGSQNK